MRDKDAPDTLDGRTLVLVVHGVGEQSEGETLDDLVGGLTGDQPFQVQSERRMLREDDLRDDTTTARDKVDLFPCETRTVRHGQGETKFAEVYWADLSRGLEGRIVGIVELFQLIMGLGHIVRENIAEKKARGTLRGWLARVFVWMLHGPLIGVNLAFGLALVAMIGLNVIFPPAEYRIDDKTTRLLTQDFVPTASMLIAAAALLGTWWYLRRTNRGESHLYTVFVRSLLGTSIAMSVLVAFTHLVPPMLSPQTVARMLEIASVELNRDCSQTIGHGLQGCYVFWYTDVMVFASNMLWGTAIFAVFALGMAQAVQDARLRGQAQQTLYPATCALMAVLWLFLALAVWVTALGALTRLPFVKFESRLLTHSFPDAVSIAIFICAALLLVVLSAGLVLGQRIRARSTHARNPSQNYTNPRMVVSPLVRIGLTLGVILLMVGVVMEAGQIAGKTRLFGGEFWDDWLPGWYADETRRATLFGIAGGIVVVIATLYTSTRPLVRVGVGTAKDIVIWFVKRSWDGNGEASYPKRRRILYRFRKVAGLMLAQGPWDNVVVISHSQGTMVAFEALRGGDLRGRVGAAYVAPRLITMGSPLWHIYGYYFRSHFAPHPADKVGIAEWLNIYRIDDFVGTDIQVWDGERNATAEVLTNRGVRAGGHTGYWTDDEVIPLIKDFALPQFRISHPIVSA